MCRKPSDATAQCLPTGDWGLSTRGGVSGARQPTSECWQDRAVSERGMRINVAFDAGAIRNVAQLDLISLP